ncbi:PQQ-binding-like beta-propeller repeat protein [Streptomyces sp. NPDC091292]|uniref:outer membrane protein assembly factor BamB family protein n=1 Tax=Streptomyces sp. NPDC091292 TaxID=3365991 RepID=UPI003818EC70
MTQPPPPPNEPPPGGFGAPQDPPPGGFGAPQTPPQTPPQGPPQDFGKPPQQPQQPPQQPGYGYPGQPPQAPQAPQTPPPAQPYGQPPQAPPQAPPQTPPAQQPYGQPAPGYGYPGAPGQQPPQYPGHPGGQPGGQPGYGYPGQQPSPYGTYPTATTPSAPSAGGGSRLGNPITLIIGAAVLVIALIVGGGVWYASSSGKDDTKNTADSGGSKGGSDDSGDKEKGSTGGGGKEKAPSNTASKVLFQVPQPEVKDKNSSITVEGSWLTDKVYAKSGIAEIVGYDRDTGKKTWTIPLPGPVCAAARHTTAENMTAIIYEAAMPTKAKPYNGCTEVSGVDLDAGELLWTENGKSGDQKINFSEVTVGANTVAAGSTSGGSAWNISDGKLLWNPKVGDTCYDAGYAGGEALAVVRKCGAIDARRLEIQTLDPASGKPLSTYKLAAGIDYASIVSTRPLVVAADVGDSAGDGSSISDFFSIDWKTGKLRAKMSAPGDRYAARCGATEVEQCTMLAVGNDRLYIPTEEHDGSEEFKKTNEIVAFDLATGKLTGQRADAGDGYTLTPLRMDGGNVIAYKSPPYDKGGQVVSISGDSFKETKLMENPATEAVRDVERSFLPSYAEILYGDGRLFMSAVYAQASSSSSDRERYLAIAYGTQ